MNTIKINNRSVPFTARNKRIYTNNSNSSSSGTLSGSSWLEKYITYDIETESLVFKTNIQSEKEITAWITEPVESDVLANLVVISPLFKPNDSTVELLFDDTQFSVIDGKLTIIGEIGGGGGTWGSITGTLSNQTDLQSALNSKASTTHNHSGTYEPVINAGTALQYYRGDKTWQTLNTSIVPELTNLYYTEARVDANTNVAANTAARHTHTNKTVLDGITETDINNWNTSYSTASPFTVTGVAGNGKVSVDRDFEVLGNITASKEVVAWLSGAVQSDVLTNLTATAPLRKSSSSNLVFDYDVSQFELNGTNQLKIKDAVLVPADHTHPISDVNGLQTALDGKVWKGEISSGYLTYYNGTTLANSPAYRGFYGNLLVGTTTDNDTDKLQVNGSVAINGNLKVTGNITATQEITAWIASAVQSDVLANLTASAPLRKSTSSNLVLDYNTSQFEVNGGNELQIKAGILAPAAHTHSISDVTGLQASLDSKQPLLNGTGLVRSTAGVISYDTSNYLTAITKAQIEAVFTGNITSHTHSYIPTSHTVNSIINGTGFLKNNGTGTWSYDSNSYSLTSHNHSGVYEPANSNIQSHISSTSNPHSVTKSQVGLSNVPNTDATNPANISQSASYRFVTDTEKSTWNGKQSALNGTGLVRMSGTTVSYDNSSYSLTSHNHSGVYEPANSNIQSHISSTSNPHSVTKAQVGLGNVVNLDTSNPANITQSASYRFVTDTEKSTWNGKQDALSGTVTSHTHNHNNMNNLSYAASGHTGFAQTNGDLAQPFNASAFRWGSNGYGQITGNSNAVISWYSSTLATFNSSSTVLPGSLQIAGAITGATTITASGEITAYSDARLKKDVQTTSDVLNKINKVRVVDYKVINGDDKVKTGVIAQELLEVFPQFVVGSDEDYYSVNYGQLATIALKAVQELTKEVNKLKEEIKCLKNGL